VEHIIITTLVLLGLGYLRGRKNGAKLESAIQDGATAIKNDPGNPITDWKSAVTEATKQILIEQNQQRIDRMVDQLEAMEADAKRDAEAALARGRATAQGMDITVVKPDPKPEDFKPVSKE